MRVRVVAWLLAVVAAPAFAGETSRPPLVTGPEERLREGTEVHFLAYKGEEQFTVTVGDQSCDTPCTLRVRPGPAKVHVIGNGETHAQMVIPHLTSQVRVSTGPPSWYLPAGAVLVPLGIMVGASMWALGFACGNSGACFGVNFAAWPILGLTMLITGAVLLHQGSRAQPLDANRPEILDTVPAKTWRFEGFGLAPARGGAAGFLAFSF